ncbi:hypothetical protein PLICRDRAFT_161041 [Plicaturopsis crispa FD-325 SS-3]|nr:hypothetical protein PLICRDRAFT_161041 [Plicaturopsis crispa FD-325 SS-3]
MERTLHPRVSSVTASMPEMYHRSYPSVRGTPSPNISPRAPPLLPASMSPLAYPHGKSPVINVTEAEPPRDDGPSICGMPLKYVSLVTLAVQNAALSIVMHYSRVSTPPSLSYSPASAVLLNELLKGSISFVIALARVKEVSEIPCVDCWKLSIPAILYVVQNSLQFVAISNLPVASFQVTYQMKILTTAAFSVALLRKRLSSTKWLSLFFLAIGVGIVQIQSSTATAAPAPKTLSVGSAHDSAPIHVHVMNPLKGFGAVTAACFTSGLAGVYFEMVLKNSKADLWVRNVQLSLFSLVPALLPIFYAATPPNSQGFFLDLFRHFGGWAWATVAVQVFGGLITAIVIKYSDNILKGFATSLSIIISFLASVALFDFRITPSFVIGSSTVLVATWMYNQPPGKELVAITSVMNVSSSGKSTPFPGSPVGPDAPILGQFPQKRPSPFNSPRAMASALGLGNASDNDGQIHHNGLGRGSPEGYFGDTLDTPRYHQAPYGSPLPSRTPTPAPRAAPDERR